MEDNKPLNEQQVAFVEAYLRTRNAYQSALKAGYSKNTAKNAKQLILERFNLIERYKAEKMTNQDPLTPNYIVEGLKELTEHKDWRSRAKGYELLGKIAGVYEGVKEDNDDFKNLTLPQIEERIKINFQKLSKIGYDLNRFIPKIEGWELVWKKIGK
jgi:hypothetical protein